MPSSPAWTITLDSVIDALDELSSSIPIYNNTISIGEPFRMPFYTHDAYYARQTYNPSTTATTCGIGYAQSLSVGCFFPGFKSIASQYGYKPGTTQSEAFTKAAIEVFDTLHVRINSAGIITELRKK